MKINIKGDDIKFGFGLYFLGRAQKERNQDLGELLNSVAKNPLSDAVDLMWMSAKIEAELDEVTLPIKKRDFIDYLDETEDFKKNDGLIATWANSFIETIKGNFLPEVEDDGKGDDIKKKSNGEKT